GDRAPPVRSVVRLGGAARRHALCAGAKALSDAPEMSVLLPVRDAGRYLRRALDDVLAQRGVRVEVIAVDDGSTDGSGEHLRRRAAQDARLRVLSGGGRGAAAP